MAIVFISLKKSSQVYLYTQITHDYEHR